ncbi:MAG: hypothetical protein AUK63_579 [bacterium P3]|nr:MAG: hypothetical protein AUK63_579 [bacterium P3]KWW42035.1 MAG: hypothetical protein F083_686 [bacterium F083]
MFVGEILSLSVAVMWTATALFAETGSKRMGSLPFNLTRMGLSLVLLALTLWLTMGMPWPRYADRATWMWMLASSMVGYVVGDYCLMKGYILIGSRFGQLFMTLSAPAAAITGRILLGERMQPLAIIGMVVTLSGICLSILSRKEPADPPLNPDKTGATDASDSTFTRFSLVLPAKGIFFAVMAGICQGIGLVLSKNGLLHYDQALTSCGFDSQATPSGALIPIPFYLSMPFAATLIRAMLGFAGFLLLLMLTHRDWKSQIRHAVSDRKAMWCAWGSTLFGPFAGVSLSLLATQYTAAGIAQTLFALTPILIIAPSVWLFHQRVTPREVAGAAISVAGVCLFFI